MFLGGSKIHDAPEQTSRQMVKNPPAKWETEVQSLGQEDPLKKGMETHSIILAWRISWTEEPGGLSPVQLSLVQSLSRV